MQSKTNVARYEPWSIFKVPICFRLLDPLTLKPQGDEYVTYTSLRYIGSASERFIKKLRRTLDTEGVRSVLMFIARSIRDIGEPPPTIYSCRSAPKHVTDPRGILSAMRKAFYKAYSARAAQFYSQELKDEFARRRPDVMAEARRLYLADACCALGGSEGGSML